MIKLFKEKSFQLLLLMGLAFVLFSCNCYECIEYDENYECKTYVDCNNNAVVKRFFYGKSKYI